MNRRHRTQKSLLKKLVRFFGSFGLLFISLILCRQILNFSEAKGRSNEPLAVLSRVAVPEMPARAVELVQAAPEALRVSVVTNTLWAVSGLARPGVMPYVISALCRAYPNLADVVVGTAVEINNTPISTIIAAAKVAAPDMISKITIGAFKGKPEDFAEIALALAYRTSATSTNILHDLCEALPSLQPFVDTARIQSDQIIADQSFNPATNQAAMQLSVIIGYTLSTITNSGLTIDEVLTNSDAGSNDLPVETVSGTNALSSLEKSTNLNNKSSVP